MAYHNTEEYISELEKRPALWDPWKDEYKNKNKKEEAWLEVCRSIYQNYEEKSEEKRTQLFFRSPSMTERKDRAGALTAGLRQGPAGQ
ncbi:hypothetical protein E2C01_065456 [Portunus trituberculatus]|uniref:MADF domain-containing protein n=1 Tax=Portunus trituberculatus TaxID=210409 RepID=A0A5B7HRS8_PORTR|nr:hypothetical protein [Portunus trituberculatus]